jgi:predicted  nucleic acid-binding Zn-ribbon protein
MNTKIESPTLLIQTLQSRIADLEVVIIKLQEKIADLQDRLNKNSRNSSKIPSSDSLSKPSKIASGQDHLKKMR